MAVWSSVHDSVSATACQSDSRSVFGAHKGLTSIILVSTLTALPIGTRTSSIPPP